MPNTSKSEIEFGGIKFKSSTKIIALITALSTFGGAIWFCMEAWSRYKMMENQISEFVAPDLSGFQERVAVTDERINSLENIVKTQLEAITIEVGALKDVAGTALDDARSIKSEIREDLHTVLDEIAVSDKRVREVSQELRLSIRNSENTIRNIIANNESRMSNLVDASSTRFAAARTQIESDFVRKSEAIDTKLLEMESRINKTLERYFKNPLLKE
tara:strand:- start:233 stop:883 length:651 start_codon:yes stop_codon:yes gene_type:complete